MFSLRSEDERLRPSSPRGMQAADDPHGQLINYFEFLPGSPRVHTVPDFHQGALCHIANVVACVREERRGRRVRERNSLCSICEDGKEKPMCFKGPEFQ